MLANNRIIWYNIMERAGDRSFYDMLKNLFESGNFMSIIKIIEELVLPIIDDLQLTLWDVEFKKEGPDYFLRIYIDKDTGVTINDCEAVSRKLEILLDEKDPIEQSYVLEVSSAGLVRELKKDFHFQKFLGKNIEIRLYKALNGQKKFTATLINFDSENLIIQIENKEEIISRKDISKVIIDLV